MPGTLENGAIQGGSAVGASLASMAEMGGRGGAPKIDLGLNVGLPETGMPKSPIPEFQTVATTLDAGLSKPGDTLHDLAGVPLPDVASLNGNGSADKQLVGVDGRPLSTHTPDVTSPNGALSPDVGVATQGAPAMEARGTNPQSGENGHRLQTQQEIAMAKASAPAPEKQTAATATQTPEQVAQDPNKTPGESSVTDRRTSTITAELNGATEPAADGNAATASLENKNGAHPPEVNAGQPTQATPEKQQRTQELEQKIKDKTATADEMKELRDLKKDPEKVRQELEQKAIDGTISDREAEELVKLNSTAEQGGKTHEQQAEELKNKVDQLGTELMMKMANGEDIPAEMLTDLQKLRGQETLMSQGLTSKEATQAIQEAFRGKNRPGSERLTFLERDIKAKLQELMALEVQMLSLPKNVDALRKQRKDVQKLARDKHSEAKRAKDNEKLQIKGQEYNYYMQIANINGEIVKMKYQVPVLEAKRIDLEQYVRRKLGVTSGFGALIEWGGAKARNVYTAIGVGVEEDVDSAMGVY